MLRIAVTTPYFYPGEELAVATALSSGKFDMVHVRKPEATEIELRGFLEKIPASLRARLTLHDHHGLAPVLGIGGVHLNSRNPKIPGRWNGRLSLSVHSFQEVERLDGAGRYNYMLFSPVFPSISKPGHLPSVSLAEISAFIRMHPELKLCALGGVTDRNVMQLKSVGFHGYAMLGSAWSRPLDREAFRFQLVTDGTAPGIVVGKVRHAVQAGCRWVQVRMKSHDSRTVEQTLELLAPLRESHGITLLVDDRVDLALRLPFVDGVHLGADDMLPGEARKLLGPDKIIGATANTLPQAVRAATAGSDYLGVGPFRFTTTKKKLAPILGAEGYRNIIGGLHNCGMNIPVVAIGGITPGDVPELLRAGVDGVAVSGAVMHSADPELSTEEFINRTGSLSSGNINIPTYGKT